MGLQNWESGARFLHCRHRQVVRVLDSEGNVRVSIKIVWGAGNYLFWAQSTLKMPQLKEKEDGVAH